eukprot:3572735-Alexandrium_andersonii.AAC.1
MALVRRSGWEGLALGVITAFPVAFGPARSPRTARSPPHQSRRMNRMRPRGARLRSGRQRGD